MEEATAQEAETAILTIGARLTWEPKTPGFEPPAGFVWDVARLGTDHGHQNYSVSFNPDHSPQSGAEVTYWNPNGRHDQKRQQADNGSRHAAPERRYNSVAEAKAACEIHAATGAW